MNDRKKQTKKKQRERLVRKKVLARRDAIRQERKEELQKKRYEEMVSSKPQPIINNTAVAEHREQIRQEKVREKLEKNVEILKQLQAEYAKENEARQTINEELESEGHVTMQEKMSAIHKKAEEFVQNYAKMTENSAEEQNVVEEEAEEEEELDFPQECTFCDSADTSISGK